MAVEIDDLELWLPSEFLTDDDILTDFKTEMRSDQLPNDFGNLLGFRSDLSSQTTETDSDEDDFMMEFGMELSRSTLEDSNAYANLSTEGLKLPAPPQSTFCGRKSDCKGTANSISRDLMHGDAGEVTRTAKAEETTTLYAATHFPPPPNPGSVPILRQNSGLYPTQYQTQARISYHQQHKPDQQMKQIEMRNNGGMWQGIEYRGRKRSGGGRRPQGLERAGSGMRAVFLGETVVRNERKGTGVFMPRRFDTNPRESCTKPGCAAVLVPNGVVNNLNCNLDSVDGPIQPRGGVGGREGNGGYNVWWGRRC